MFRLCCGGGSTTSRKASSSPANVKSITRAAAAAAAAAADSSASAAASGAEEKESKKAENRPENAKAKEAKASSIADSSSSNLNLGGTNPPQATSSFPATEALWPLITAASQRALGSGALCPIDTAVTPERLSDGGWSFVLRVASNLRSKDADVREQKRKEEDAASASASAASSGPERRNTKREESPPPLRNRSPSPPPPIFNPFLPYDQRLWVAHLPPSHELLLNKFPVSMNHALVVTRDFAEQEEVLTVEDLKASWAVLDSMPGAGGMAFFNRGRASGASQRHKHLQVVPLPLDGDGNGFGGSNGGGGGGAGDWAPFEGVALAATAAAGAAPLAVVPLGGKSESGGENGDKDEDGNGLPFRAFAARMPPRGGPSAEALQKCVAELVEAACGKKKTEEQGDQGEQDDFSFNLLLTRRVAVVVPRRSGRFGFCSPNAVAFAGSMLARSEEELRFVREKGPMAILAECGFPW